MIVKSGKIIQQQEKINAGEILPHTIISLNKTCNIRLLGNKENFILSMSY